MTARWVGATLSLALLALACRSLRVIETHDLGPIGRLHASNGSGGRLLATMSEGTSGRSVLELPSGDLLLSGQGDTSFLQRLSPEGETRWTLQACGLLEAAVAGEDGLYAAASAFLDARGRAGEPAPFPPGTCNRSPGVRTSTTVARLDGRGVIQWKLDTRVAGSALSASKDHVFVVGIGGEVGSEHGELLAITPRGQIAWTRESRASMITTVGSPARSVFVAWALDEGPKGHPRACTLVALDEATGTPVWEQKIEFPVAPLATPWDCTPERILVSARGGILLAERWIGSTYDRVLIGFDLSTGAVRWQREIDVYNFVPRAGVEKPSPLMPLLAVYQHYEHQNLARFGTNPVVIALDPESGRHVPVAVFRGDLVENAGITGDSRVTLSGYAWGRGGIVATGDFRGRLLVDGLDADSESTVRTSCINIDPGFGGGSLRDKDGRCKFGTEDVRLYAPTLFVARVPVGGSR